MTANTKILKVKSDKFNLLTCIHLILFIILFNVVFPDCIGQITFTVSEPQLSISNNNLIITYDILGAKADEKFNIWLEISDNNGVKINASTLSGDIGDSITGGANKRIVWNLLADNIFIDNTVNVEIIAEKIIIPEIISEEKDLSEIPSDISKKEDMADEKESYKHTEEPVPTYARVKVGNHLLQSTVFPGWGLTRLSKGKPYWLMGVAGIGCIASSIYFNQKAHSSYDTYLTSADDNIIDYWQDAERQGDISNAFAWSAAVIWIADLGIVTIKASSINKSYRRSRLSAFSINPYVDSNTSTPMLSLNYKF